MELISRCAKETKNFAKKFAKQALKMHSPIIISLEGELGAGKTTFVQGFAGGLGIKKQIQSPTFVILKVYAIHQNPHKTYDLRQLVHVDAYRLKAKDFKVLGWKDFTKDPHNIILVEWGNRIRKILPKNTIQILFHHNTRTTRKIIIKT